MGMMAYLEGEEPSTEKLKECIRKGTLNIDFIPVVTGTAFKNKGVQPMLDAIVDYMPSPLDREAIKGVDAKDVDQEITRPSSDDEPFAALAFKIMNDPFVGTLTFTRIYSGVLEAGTSVKNSVKGKNERIGRMLQMHANERTEVKRARAGDIVAIVGLKDTTTGDTLCDPNNVCILERMEFPAPVIKVAVEPKTKADQEKMGIALNRLAKEDPSFRYSRDEETGQTTIEGMGELHLEIIVDRMKREFKVDCNSGEPQVAYREAITQPATVEYTHKKQSGGSGQFAKVRSTSLQWTKRPSLVRARSPSSPKLRAVLCPRSTSLVCRRGWRVCCLPAWWQASPCLASRPLSWMGPTTTSTPLCWHSKLPPVPRAGRA